MWDAPGSEGAAHQHPHPSGSCFLSQERLWEEDQFWDSGRIAAVSVLLLRLVIWIFYVAGLNDAVDGL